MMSLKENQVVPTILSVYNRIKTYRPHVTEENRIVLVQNKMLKDYGLTVTSDDLKKIVEVQEKLGKSVSRRPVLIKRDLNKGEWSQNPLPIERKRVYHNISDNNSGDNIKKHRYSTRADFTFRNISPGYNFEASSISKVSNTSRIPRPTTFQFSKQPNVSNNNNNESTVSKNVFDRLYERRPKPCPATVSFVEHVRKAHTTKALSNKPPPKSVSCTFHEPPSKRGRYNKDCLNDTLNCSVFDRLYAERKQLNTKKLTDVQKRELYLKKQREEIRKAKEERICRSRHSSSTISATSDIDMSELNDDVFESTLDNAANTSKCSSIPECDLFNTTTKTLDESDTKRVQGLLDSLAERFHENMSLVQIDDSVFEDAD